MKRNVSYFILYFFCSKLFAGWISGGGEILGYHLNPWFVDRHKNPISYCIKIAPEMNLNESQAQKAIKSAFSFWENQFENAVLSNNVKYSFESPKYINVLAKAQWTAFCAENTDIVFQLGYLDSEQLLEFQKNNLRPQQFIGLTIRSDYKSVPETPIKRGKGFIYISPQYGELAFEAKAFKEDIWNIAENTYLIRALQHELGHVFGLSHQGESHELMSENFLERMINPAEHFQGHYFLNQKISFLYPAVKKIMHIDQKLCACRELREIFQIEEKMRFIKIEFDWDRIQLYVSESNYLNMVLYTTAVLSPTVEFRRNNAVNIVLKKEHTQGTEFANRELWYGPQVVDLQFNGIFRNSNNESMPLFMQLKDTYIQLGVVKNNIMYPNILKEFFSSMNWSHVWKDYQP